VVEAPDRAAGAAGGSAASEDRAEEVASVAEVSAEPAVAVTLAAADQEAVGEEQRLLLSTGVSLKLIRDEKDLWNRS